MDGHGPASARNLLLPLLAGPKVLPDMLSAVSYKFSSRHSCQSNCQRFCAYWNFILSCHGWSSLTSRQYTDSDAVYRYSASAMANMCWDARLPRRTWRNRPRCQWSQRHRSGGTQCRSQNLDKNNRATQNKTHSHQGSHTGHDAHGSLERARWVHDPPDHDLCTRQKFKGTARLLRKGTSAKKMVDGDMGHRVASSSHRVKTHIVRVLSPVAQDTCRR